MLVMNWIPATGAQMRSILLGEIVFNTVPMKQNITTNHMAILENGCRCGNSKSALANTINAMKDNMIMFMIATILILGGYFPGNFPPIDAVPQGTPAARHP